ncbi:Membrane-fusion protein [Candidatus Burkholderia verschuerenii]|uniref:Membrane-fusion protein n=1 Tax=Candidatus Burkholderia verschuerenii TaxID=242163 RepID=A0A0L0MAA0_9BURK|nr:efflux RND transporter periplasmic adaptor subunit [Candidatus Burkholderia verschuerenii]KND59221.1 Membrane-fusion protein [Candidatus Burkholderia verschuerenii]
MPNRFIYVAALLCVALSNPLFADEPSVAVQTVAPQRGVIAQPVHAYGVVDASASNLVTVNLPYVARVMRMLAQSGQRVARGTPLFVVQADPAAALGFVQARSAATLVQDEMARTQSLYDKGLATASQLAVAKKAAQDAQETLSAQQKLGATLGDKTVTATEAGVVLQVQAGNGDQVQAGAPILQIAGSGGARGNVMLGVEPADAARLHAGDPLTLNGLSTPLADASIKGSVVLVGASIDPQTQLVDVAANVPLTGTAFIPGTRTGADISTSEGSHWIVPRNALLKDGKGAYVYQIAKNKHAHRVNVALKVENGARYGVDGPLDAALPLVVSGNYELADGMTVRTQATPAEQGSASR